MAQTRTLPHPSPARADDRIDRLSTSSLRRVIEPDLDLRGSVGAGQVVPDELLSTAGTTITLTGEQRAQLSREEVAAVTQIGVALEGLLTAALSIYIAEHRNLEDPRVTYALHEIGEESRHSRLFIRLVGQLNPQATNPLRGRIGRALQRRIARAMCRDRLFMAVMVLAGEEIPDQIQKRTGEHPGTDPFLVDVNRYHRSEEARHIAFARTVLPEFWNDASALQRFRVRYLVPALIQGLFEILIHPGVYAAVGLPGWATWRDVNRSPHRRSLRHAATAPIVDTLVDAGAFPADRIPRPWRRLAGR
jgi:hypothetical protein